ncbi:MAG: hypothetical protein HOM47_02530 [Euryarchaeota archaeon]|jgi:hypothetical protein|nr:hypothetical protein [Euryarchaeota archaeon]MBT5184032.1 hypothetical protein [Euryarchaeota archaeon]
MANEAKIDHSSLDHGFFQFTFPHTWKSIIPWIIAILLYSVAGFLIIYSFDIPDVPPISEGVRIDSLDEIQEDDQVSLSAGWENQGDSANFVIMDVVIESGTLVHGYWEYDSDGENCSDYVDIIKETLTVYPKSGSGQESFSINWNDEIGAEVDTISRNCDTGYEDWFVNEGDTIEIFMMEHDDALTMLSVGAEGLDAPERTEREDSQRVALLIIIVASVIMMITTPTSLSDDIKKLRNRWGNLPFVHGKPGELESAEGPVRQIDNSDWVLPPPGFETWPDNPYESNLENDLIQEHPNVIGTPSPATFTLYSVNGIIFITTSLWLASDLLARHGDGTHLLLGKGLRIGIIIFTLIWGFFAWKKWKLMHNIIDTPTSKVRSVAVGPAELVGQVRPGPDGTLSIDVGESSSRRVQGVVSFKWKEEEYICTKDSDGKESCSWKTRRTGDGNQEFILHDGTGGILVDPASWKDVRIGEKLHRWENSRWRWTVWVLAAGDPVYCLGRVETRTEDEKEDGIDGTIASSHLIVRGNKDIGMQVHLNRGTELSVLSGLRSTTESIIVPLVMLTFSAIPFLW